MNAIRVAALARLLVITFFVATFARIPSAAGAVVFHDSGVATPPLRTNFACSKGPGPLDPTTSYAAGDGWNWVAWHIAQETCGNCPAPGLVEARQVSFATRAFTNCDITVQVSIVGTTGVDCRMPDTTQVLDGPFSYPVAVTASVGEVHSIPLPAGWCLTQDASVLIRFVGGDGCLTSKGPMALDRTNVPCVGCDEWFTAFNAYPTPTNVCSVFSSPIWVQLDTECCGATSSARRSWGRVKTLYR